MRLRCFLRRRKGTDLRDLKKRKKLDNLPGRKLQNKPLKPEERRLRKKGRDSRQNQMLPMLHSKLRKSLRKKRKKDLRKKLMKKI